MDVIAELDRIERLKERQNWNAILSLARLPVLSSREIAMVRVNDPPFLLTRVACYRRDPETLRLYRHGETIGWGYQARSKRTPKKPRCFHPQLLSEEWGGLVFRYCKDCGQWLNNGSEVVSLRAAKIIRGNRQLWKDRKRTPVYHKSAYDGNGLTEGKGTEYTLNRFEFVRFPSRLERLFYFDRSEGWVERVAPEIERRTLDAAWRYVLSSPDFREYRAPYAKVREMRDAGFSIPQMARKLKVSERTINNRLADVPRTVAPPDLLALRVNASGGYTVRTFWPSNGVDHIPRGSRATSPLEIPRWTRRVWLPVQRERVTFPLRRGPQSSYDERHNMRFPASKSPHRRLEKEKPVASWMWSPMVTCSSLRVCADAVEAIEEWWYERRNRASSRQILREYGRRIAPSRFECKCKPRRLKGRLLLTVAERALDFSGRWWEKIFFIDGEWRMYPRNGEGI